MAALCDLEDDGVLVPLHARDGSVRARALIDAVDEARVCVYRWHLGSLGYAKRTVYISTGRWASRSLHRDVLGLEPGDKRPIDHINCDPLDNRRANLRILTTAENAQNRRGGNRGSLSKYRGVTWSKKSKKWAAGAMLDGKQYWLGAFEIEWDAALRAIEFRAEHMPAASDAEWLADYRGTQRDLDRLRFAEPRSESGALTVAEQIETCERHLARLEAAAHDA